jgi:tetratricopeptide (TPR) repeat protein
VTAQLIDASTRAHLWAERFDRELEDIFALQDEITEAIVGALEPELGAAERERARRKPPNSLDAWSCHQRGLWHAYRYQQVDASEALRLFERAIELDRGFGRAYAGKSFCHFINVFLDWTADPVWELAQAHRAAVQGVGLDEKDAFAHWMLGRALLMMREHDEAIAEFEAAIDLSPSFAHAHHGLGWALSNSQRSEEALTEFDKAYRLSPRDPLLMNFANSRAVALIILKRYAEAVQWARFALRQPNAHFRIHAALTAALGHFGRIDEARKAMDETLRIRPDYSRALVERIMPFKHREDMEHFLEGLRKAGLSA